MLKNITDLNDSNHHNGFTLQKLHRLERLAKRIELSWIILFLFGVTGIAYVVYRMSTNNPELNIWWLLGSGLFMFILWLELYLMTIPAISIQFMNRKLLSAVNNFNQESGNAAKADSQLSKEEQYWRHYRLNSCFGTKRLGT